MNAPPARRLALAVLAASLAALPVRAQNDGDLDLRFGNNGGSYQAFEWNFGALAIASAPDGGLFWAEGTAPDLDFMVKQTEEGGAVIDHESADFALGGGDQDVIDDVAVGADGKPVLAGVANDGTVENQVAVARFALSPFLALDSSFSGDGMAAQNFFGDAQVRAVAVGPSGETVVVGCYETGTTAGLDFIVLRFLSTGAPDNGFDGNGVRTLNFNHAATEDDDDCALAVAIQADGKIVVAGWTRYGTTDYDFAIARFNLDGSLDANFAAPNGFRFIAFDQGGSDRDEADDLALDSRGRIVLLGSAATDTGYKPTVVRLSNVGVKDSSFGDGGTFYGSEGVAAIPVGLAILPFPSRRILYVTYRGTFTALTDGGELDPSFGDGGVVVIEDPNLETTESIADLTMIAGMPVVLGHSAQGDTKFNFTTRLWMAQIFGDDFESGNTNAWRGW